MTQEPLFVLTSAINRKNRARCEVYEDRVVLETVGEGFFPVYDVKSRVIPIGEIRRVAISVGGVKLLVHHPNCIHFVTDASARTVDDMFRDSAFRSHQYIDEGVHQFSPKSEEELKEKLAVAERIKDYIESKTGERR